MSTLRTHYKAPAEEFTVRLMTEHDLLEVVEIEEASGLSRWGWEAYYAELSDDQSAVMLVARREVFDREHPEKYILGFIAARLVADEVHINNVAVRHTHRRRGLGDELLAAALTEGARKGARSALLEVRLSNVAAQSLYRKHGFRVTGSRRNYYSDPLEDALVMSRALKLNLK